MLDFFICKFKEYRCRFLLKRYCEPDKKFLAECREVYLEKFDAQIARKVPNIPLRRRVLAPVFKYGIISFSGLFLLGGGAVVYADKQNVSYNHPLYQFKRLGEAMRLQLASAETQPDLHDQLAKRRLQEIKAVNAQIKATPGGVENLALPQSNERQLLIKLDQDLYNEASLSIQNINIQKGQSEKMSRICKSVSETLKEGDQMSVEMKINGNNNNSAETFKKGCHGFIDEKEIENLDGG
jgi:hypothetical protein